EARIVELDREVVAALVGAFRPGGPDLGAADIDAIARGILAHSVGLRNDAYAPALQAQRDDLALEIVAGLLEGADICHVTSPWLSEPATIAASMAICRPKVIAAAPVFGPERSGGWQRQDCLGPRGMRVSAGEESRAAAIAAQAIEAQPSFGQIKPS